VLVVDAMTGQEAVNVAKAFDDQVGVDGAILTKLDGDARGGAALSMREAIGKPIMYSGVGEKVSELEPFHPERMASRILGMGDVLTLIEKAQVGVDERKAKEMEDRLLSGRLTMEDWLGQMRQLRQMGPLEGILGMLPGMGKQVRALGDQMPTEKDLGRLEAIVLSMTVGERRKPEIIKGSRRKRIAMGSGTDITEVNRMLKGFEQMQQVFKQLGGGKGTKGARGKMRMLKNLQGLDPTQLGGL
jgi:signal recognition particle subunit SRP54